MAKDAEAVVGGGRIPEMAEDAEALVGEAVFLRWLMMRRL